MNATEHRKIDSLNLSKEILKKGNRVRIPVVGSSMYPLFRKGDIIFIEPVDIEQTLIGDIIVCQRRNRMYAHRLMKKYMDNGRVALVTKGDFFSGFDERLYSEDVLGKVTAIERKGRHLSIDNGLYGAVNIFCRRLSPFNKWIYPHLRKVKRKIYRIKNRYADRRAVNMSSCKTKY